jgi:hypothetical protein
VQKPLWSSRRLVSLWDMLKFPIIQFWWLSHELKRLQSELPDTLDRGWAMKLEMAMNFAQNQFVSGEHKVVELGDAAKMPLFHIRAALQKYELSGQCDLNIKQELAAMLEGIEIELSKFLFVHIQPENAKYFEQEKLFGDSVYEKFAEASGDLKDAGNCFAASLPTACVFHLMRVAEFGMRSLANKLRVTITHKKKNQPIEYADWNDLITGIRNKIAKVRLLSKGPKRQEKLDLYSSAADHCEYMKDIWRNEVSHARKAYNESEAKAVLDRVQDFMRFLATNI